MTTAPSPAASTASLRRRAARGTCAAVDFAAGASYPTVHLDKIQERLDRLSVEIRDRVQSRFKELHEVFVPVSMALLTNYDDAYLGIGPAPKES